MKKSEVLRSLKINFANKALLYIILLTGVYIVLFPFAWMLSGSIKANADVFEYPIRWIPKAILWRNYIEIWTSIKFGLFYFNTIKITVVIVILQLTTSSLAAYAFARIKFPERNKLFIAYIGTIAVPYQVYMLPQFIIIKKLGLYDTHTGYILLQAFTAFGVFLMRQFYMSIPEELSESARIDGLNEFGIYRRIILPLSKPALASLGIFTTVMIWNDFLGPLIYFTSEKNKTIQLGITLFMNSYGTDFALIMAAAVCSMLPILIVFFSAQKFFIEGIATTGLKG
ncbi:MAG: carbohydrate ABC transporter permease [Clostridia bacterium]|nr:carbohydrate ABC transporter permease [Clostridia bacterium]